MLLALHTPGLNADYLRSTAYALDEDALFVEYAPCGDVTSWVAQAEALRVARGIERWNVLGHGLGGMVAQTYAAAHAERVDKLMLCSTAPSLEWVPNLAQLRRALESADDRQLAEVWREVLPAAFANPRSPLQAMFNPRQICKRTLTSAFLSLEPQPDRGIKTLLFHGRLDRLFWIDEGGEKLLELLADAELVVLERSGHFPFLEQPASFFMEAEAFLRGEEHHPEPLFA